MSIARLTCNAALLVAVLIGMTSGPVRSGQQLAYRGPCLDALASGGQPPACPAFCLFVCWDPFVDITYQGANCADDSGPCRRAFTAKPSKIVRRCDCGFVTPICTDAGTYTSGTVGVYDCI